MTTKEDSVLARIIVPLTVLAMVAVGIALIFWRH
jgi:hypothetical protein